MDVAASRTAHPMFGIVKLLKVNSSFETTTRMDGLDSVCDEYYDRLHRLSSEFEIREFHLRKKCTMVGCGFLDKQILCRESDTINVSRQRTKLKAFVLKEWMKHRLYNCHGQIELLFCW